MTTATLTIKPTEHQAERLAQISDWWNLPASHPEWKNCVLSAPAGAGKTTIARFATAQLPNVYPLFTATTNEAARQLSLTGIGEVITTHSALGLQPRIDQEVPFFAQAALPEDFYDFNLLVVDEASMASRREKEGNHPLLVDYIESERMRVLWLGDGYQLPPVESTSGIAPVFEMPWKQVTLTEIMRNSGDILSYCTAIRKVIDSPIRRLPKVPKSSVITSLRQNQLVPMLKEGWETEKFQSGATRIIVWRNDNADRLNECIRQAVFGPVAKEAPLMVRDQILFTSPFVGGKFPENVDNLQGAFIDKAIKIEAATNMRGEVLTIEQSDLYGINCYKVKVRLETSSDVIGYIPTTVGAAKLARLKKAFVNSIAAESGRAKAAKWAWWHTFNSCFGKVKHAYVITAHRAQGSSIEHSIVDVGDILSCRQSLLAYKILYTGCSRAKKQLTLVRNI